MERKAGLLLVTVCVLSILLRSLVVDEASASYPTSAQVFEICSADSLYDPVDCSAPTRPSVVMEIPADTSRVNLTLKIENEPTGQGSIETCDVGVGGYMSIKLTSQTITGLSYELAVDCDDAPLIAYPAAVFEQAFIDVVPGVYDVTTVTLLDGCNGCVFTTDKTATLSY